MAKKAASKEVEITELKIKLGRKTITLSTEEARKLHDALDELFEKEVVVKGHDHHHHSPWYWHYPQWTYTSTVGSGWDTTSTSAEDNYTVCCSNNSGSITLDLEGGDK